MLLWNGVRLERWNLEWFLSISFVVDLKSSQGYALSGVPIFSEL